MMAVHAGKQEDCEEQRRRTMCLALFRERRGGLGSTVGKVRRVASCGSPVSSPSRHY